MSGRVFWITPIKGQKTARRVDPRCPLEMCPFCGAVKYRHGMRQHVGSRHEGRIEEFDALRLTTVKDET